jgi:hypothetical protein
MINYFFLSLGLVNASWLQKLAYIADIFTKIDELNLTCEGKIVSIFTARDRIASFQRRLEFWERNVDRRQYECSAILNDFLIEAESSLEEIVYGNIVHYLSGLQQAFRNSSHLLAMRLPGSKIHIAFQRNRMTCLCKITNV